MYAIPALRLISLVSNHPSDFDSTAHPLFRRCVQCPTEPPSCPACGQGESCSLKAQSCDACASTTCVKIGSLPGQVAPKKSTPVGAIVGGVIGGLALVAILSYIVYRFYFRKKRRADTWNPPEKRDQSTLHRADRQSTRSAHSIASTVLTRASNVIQIAYIPGVTVRSPPESPALLVPPVPAIPGGSWNNSAASTPHLEEHFFMPSDLRDSTWSDTSSVDPRISLATSLARESVATTIYRSDAAVPPIPAQQAFRGQANMVSVRSGNTTASGLSGTPNGRTPVIPQGSKLSTSNSSIVARNVTARPIEVKKPASSGTRVPTLANLAKEASRKSSTPSLSEPGKSNTSTTSQKTAPVYDDEKEVALAGSPTTVIEDSPTSPVMKPKPSLASFDTARSSSVSALLPSEGPLSGGGSGPTHRHSNSAALNIMIEDAINRARDPQHMRLGSAPSRSEPNTQDSGPFSDLNELK